MRAQRKKALVDEAEELRAHEAATAQALLLEKEPASLAEHVEVMRQRALAQGAQDMRRIATVVRTWLAEESSNNARPRA